MPVKDLLAGAITPAEVNGWMVHLGRMPAASTLLLFIAALLASFFWERPVSPAGVAAYLRGEGLPEVEGEDEPAKPVDPEDPEIQKQIRAVAARYRADKERG